MKILMDLEDSDDHKYKKVRSIRRLFEESNRDYINQK